MKKAFLATAAISAVAIFGSVGQAKAFCGFYVAPGEQPLYNDASMVALMREGTRTVLSMSNNYRGPAKDFAMVVPVPVVLSKETVKTLPKSVFQKLEALTAPRLVEYWEQDPCPRAMPPAKPSGMGGGAGPLMKSPAAAAKKDADYGVTVEAKFDVGEYEILILSAKDSSGLETYLLDNKYNIPKGASGALAPYIREGMKFFVAKIDSKKVTLDAAGSAQLSPLRFSYESADFRLPVRLGLLNSQGKQDLLIFTLSKTKRYEAANYANAFIPTNLEVADSTRKSFNSFYAGLFDETVTRSGQKAIVTEYSWISTNCDPCPVPPLDGGSIATLGGDVLFGMGVPMEPTGAIPPPRPMPGPGGPMKPGRPPPFFGGGGGMVLTRLHTRYDATSLSEDIVFAAGEPVIGGREVHGEGGAIEKGARASSVNNFQARYIIRHAWTGAIACKSPVRGVWGGPPSGVAPPVSPATNLAAAPRVAGLKLTTFLKAGMPEFDIRSAPGIPPLLALPAAIPGIEPVAPPGDAAPAGSAVVTIEEAGVSPATSGATVAPGSGGCACELPGGVGRPTAYLTGSVVGLSALLSVLRRRRK